MPRSIRSKSLRSRLRDYSCSIPDAKALDELKRFANTRRFLFIRYSLDYKLALEAAKRGAAALRINPGNIGSMERVDAVIDAAKETHIPYLKLVSMQALLPKEFDTRQDMTLVEKLVARRQNL